MFTVASPVFSRHIRLVEINNKTPNVSVGIWVYAVFDIHYAAATISVLK